MAVQPSPRMHYSTVNSVPTGFEPAPASSMRWSSPLMTANELFELKENDERKFVTAMQQATCRTYNFRVRGKMETFQDQPK